jgi:signal transduction histidine kinase
MSKNIFDKLNFVAKTKFLVILVTFSMLLIIGMSMYAIFSFKKDIDTLFNKRTIPVVKLENLKDFYKINIYETIKQYKNREITLKQAKEVVSLAEEVIKKTWKNIKPYSTSSNEFESLLFYNVYKFKNRIDKQVEQFLKTGKVNFKSLKSNVNMLNIYLSDIINSFIKKAVEQKRKTDERFSIILALSVISIIFVFIVTITLIILIVDNFMEIHEYMDKKIKEKTFELENINKNLEKRIKKAIEENRRKDKIMFQQSKLASMGEMLQNISHQWRQPLASLALILQSIQLKNEYKTLNPEFLDKKISEAMNIIENMSSTIDDFRNFFRPDKVKKKLNIKTCILNSISLMSYEFEKYSIKVDLQIRDVFIYGYANELSHVCLNILSNAVDEFKNSNVDNRKILITVREKGNDIIISVIDNAGGIKTDVEKIFEPYYTTKLSSGGSGIGLYMAKQIIETHMGGKIRALNIKHKMGTKKFYNCAMFEIILKKNNEEL